MGKLLNTLKELDSIAVVESASSWQDAVRLCFKPLVDKGYITSQYPEAAIASGKKLDFYYLIAEGLAMPHARPEEGALKSGFSLLIVRQGVNFESHRNNPVYCIIGLAATDSDGHIEAMMDISEIFGDEKTISSLAVLNTADEVFAFLSKLS